MASAFSRSNPPFSIQSFGLKFLHVARHYKSPDNKEALCVEISYCCKRQSSFLLVACWPSAKRRVPTARRRRHRHRKTTKLRRQLRRPLARIQSSIQWINPLTRAWISTNTHVADGARRIPCP